MSEFHLQKLPASPAFSHLYSQSLLSFCIMPPHLSPSLPLSLCLPPSLPPCLPLSVLLCLLSSCIASPALWCGTDNQNSAHIRTRTAVRTHTQAHTHVRTLKRGDTRPPLPAAPLSLSHLSTADTKHSTTPGMPVLHQETLLALHQISILHSYTMWRYHKEITVLIKLYFARMRS